MKFTKTDTKYMQMALDLAAKAKDKTYPNPMVGAVIVKRGKVVGKGYHRRAGEDHAEIRAIKNSKGACKGGTMYVTLEPCDHLGKTPPCSKALIKNGIKNVVLAMKDPNPITSGQGIKRLRNAGIKVKAGLLEAEARELNRKYVKFIETGMPYVTVKFAQSLDGKIAARDGSSQWISSEKSRTFSKKIRASYDAVMVGINTVLNDDPFLLDLERKGYNTARVVVDSRLRMPLNSNLTKTADKSPVIIVTTDTASVSKVMKLSHINGVDVLITRTHKGRVSMKGLLSALAKRGIVNLFVEGGGAIIGSLLDEGLADEAMIFIAPKIIGGPYSSVKGRGVANIRHAIELEEMKVSRSGEDILIRGKIKRS